MSLTNLTSWQNFQHISAYICQLEIEPLPYASHCINKTQKKKKKSQALSLSDKDLTTILVDQPKFTIPVMQQPRDSFKQKTEAKRIIEYDVYSKYFRWANF